MLLPLPVCRGFSLTGGDVLHVDTGAQEFTVGASGAVTEVLPEPAPPAPVDRAEERWVIDGRVFTGRSDTLTQRDADLEVVRRIRLPWRAQETEQVGHWLGGRIPAPRDSGGGQTGSETYRLIDPLTGAEEFSVPVTSSDVTAQWLDGELWIVDSRLRVFTRDATGEWTGSDTGIGAVGK